ncbi:MAG TPA: SLOG family protein, partial [Treponemataceae bacterium]|nr:SLOG family protein [Treponemataceae bacterium]
MSEQSIDQKTEFRYKLKEIISSLIKDYRVNYFISGVGLGFEQSAVEIVLELKEEEYSPLTIEAVLPYESLSIEWNKLQRDKYYSIMQKIDKETL